MAFTKEKKRNIYRKLLTNLYNGEYISKARDNIDISASGVNVLIDMMTKDSLVFVTRGSGATCYVNFTNKGIDILRKSFGDDLFR